MRRNLRLWSGQKSIRSIILFILMFLLAISIGYYALLSNLTSSYRRVDTLYLISSQLNDLEKAAVEEETARRGYDLTGMNGFLQSFQTGTANFERAAGSLGKETSLSKLDHDALQVTIRLGEDWRREYGFPQVQTKQAGQRVSDLQLALGKAALNHFQDSCTKLQSVIMTEKTTEQSRLFHSVLWTINSSAAIVVLLCISIFVSLTRYIMNRKLTEKALRESQTSLAHAQRIAHVGSWEWDIHHDMNVWSQEMYHIFGIHRRDFDGTSKQIFEFVHPDDRAAVLQYAHDTWAEKRLDFVFRIVRPNGEVRPVHAYGEVELGRNRPVRVFGTLQDISDWKQTEELLLKSEKLSAVGQLAAGVAHEVRNPLTALKGFLQLLPTASSEVQMQYIDIMKGELQRIEIIASELLVLAKPQAVNYKSENLPEKLDEVVTLLNTHAILNNVEISTTQETHIPLIKCESNQMKQVFLNIIKNAIEAMPNGGQLQIVMRAQVDVVTIQFTDTGPGIDPDRVARIGEPFYTTKEKGTGLGLMVTRKIIENHNGTFHIESKLGVGTIVRVVLPVVV